MTVLTWNTSADFDAAQTQSGVAHDGLAPYSDTSLQLGADRNSNTLLRSAPGTFAYNHPYAIRHQDGSSVWHTYVGGIDENGVVTVCQINENTGEVTYAFVGEMAGDDHNNPTLFRRPWDSKIVVFYSNHGNDSLLRYRISVNADDVSEFGAEQTITTSSAVSYHAPKYNPSDSTLYLFTRIAIGSTNYLELTDDGSGGFNVSAEKDLFTAVGSRAYPRFSEWRNGRLDIGLTNWGTDRWDVYHYYFDGTSLYDSAGNQLNGGALPVNDDTGTLVWDSSTKTKNFSWIYDCASFLDNSNHRPELAFIVWEDGVEPSIEYQWARWDGANWSISQPTGLSTSNYNMDISDASASEGYAPGIILDHSTPGRMLVAQAVSNSETPFVSEVVTTDNGSNWTLTPITTEAAASGWRPIIPITPDDVTIGPGTLIPYFWFEGRYSGFTDYATDLVVPDRALYTQQRMFLPMDDASAPLTNVETASDALGNPTLNNGTFTSVTGILGRNAVSFDGSTSFSIPTTGDADFRDRWFEGTWVVIFETTQTSEGAFFGCLNSNDNTGFWISHLGDGSLKTWVRDADNGDFSGGGTESTTATTLNANDGNIHVAAFQFEGSNNGMFWFDGDFVGGSTVNVSDFDPAADQLDEFDISLGARRNRSSDDLFFNGTIYEVRYYARGAPSTVMTHKMLKNLYDQLSSGTYVSSRKVA